MQQVNDKVLKFWIKKINIFLKQRGLHVEPFPEVKIVHGDAQANDVGDILIMTGGYMFNNNLVVLSVDNRHIKDILRSYVHEMIHHSQWLDNPDYVTRVSDDSMLDDNNQLEELEGEAYLKGNLLFRKFTEQLKKETAKAEKN